MADRAGIFSGENPFEITKRWLAEATSLEPSDANAVSLATVDAEGLPNVRVVLLKEIEPDAFVFYTNYESAKGRELDRSGKAAFGIHWKSLKRQIRARGVIERVTAEQSDAYFHARPLESRIGAWASQQSRPIETRAVLEHAIEEMGVRHGPTPKRPDYWGGYRLRPLEMEFWADGPFRLHDRFRWWRQDTNSAWSISRLNP